MGGALVLWALLGVWRRRRRRQQDGAPKAAGAPLLTGGRVVTAASKPSAAGRRRGGGGGGGGGGRGAAASQGAAAAAAAAADAAAALRQPSPPPLPASIAFTAAQVSAITSGFRDELGTGAYGSVFRGELPDGRPVAVKQMLLAATALGGTSSSSSSMAATADHGMAATGDRAVAGGGGNKDASPIPGGEKYEGEDGFRRELEALRHYRHANIVGLLGYCIDYGQQQQQQGGGGSASVPRFCLVLELCVGGSLESRLKATASNRARGGALTAEQRCNIASDVGRGLHYLHAEASPPLIHQDVKSDNVLLTVDLATGRASSLARHA